MALVFLTNFAWVPVVRRRRPPSRLGRRFGELRAAAAAMAAIVSEVLAQRPRRR